MKKSLATKLLGAAALLLAATAVGALPSQAQAPQELKVGVEDLAAENLDPIMPGAEHMLKMVYDSPFNSNDDGTVAPAIVTKWEMAPDGLSWTFTIRDDVLFHDGSKVTAADVAFSYERVVGDDAYWSGYWKGLLGDKPKIEVIDDKTLKIYTKGPQPLLPVLSNHAASTSIYIVPKAYIEKNGLDYFRAHPIGTGPYKFSKLVAGDREEFEAIDYPHWSGVVPDFKKVTEFEIPEETTRIAMLSTGELDVTLAELDTAINLKQQGVAIAEGAAQQAAFYNLGAYSPIAKGMPLADVRVRHALSLAINRQEIIDTMFHGLASMPAPACVGWLYSDLTPALKAKLEDWVKVNYRYDPAEAKRLMTEAGYPDGFSFDFWVAPDELAPYLADLVTAAAGYWQAVGIHVNIIPVDVAVWKANRFTAKSDKLVGKMGVMASSTVRPSTIEQLKYFTSNASSMDVLAGSPDIAEFDALYAEGMSTIDEKRREQIIERMVDISANSWTGFGIIAVPTTVAFGPRVKGEISPATLRIQENYANWKYTGVNQ